MMVKAESAQERGLSAGMSEIAAAAAAAVREKKARPDAGTEFRGVRRPRRRAQSGKYGAQIWHPWQRNNVWLGTAEDAAKAYDAAAVELRGAAAKINFKSPAAVRSSPSVTVVKEETAQEQGLSAGNREIADEHGDGVEAVERRQKRALPDTQTKFKNVHKYYYKRRKDSRAGRDDGKTCRFFQQLDELHGPAGVASRVVSAVAVPGMVEPSAVRPLAEPPSVGVTAGMATPVVGGDLSFSTSNTQDYSDEEDMGERGKRKRTSEAAGAGSGTMMRFFEGLMKQETERQEAIEKREQDRVNREEAWRRQEMERLARDQERAVAATRDATVLSFIIIQKITGQSISMPSMPPPPPSSQTQATPVAYASAPPPSSPPSTLPQPSPRPQKPLMMPSAAPQLQKSQAPATQQQQAMAVHQSSTDIVMMPAEMPHDASRYDGSGGCGGAPFSSLWSKAEVDALIQLHSYLDMRRKGPKAPLWEDISAGMRRMGYSRSSKRCREKWCEMNYYFNKMKESNKKRPENSKTCPYFHQLEALYHNKAALGSAAGAGGAATGHANAAPLDRIEAFTVALPISQRDPQPHTLPPVAKNGVTNNEGNGHGVAGVSGATQMQASDGAGNRFVFSEESSMDLHLNDLPELPVRSSTISVGAEVEEFLKDFTAVVA